MRKFFWSKNAVARLKISAFWTFVYPVATWGCEVWTYTPSQEVEINAWLNNKLRIINGIRRSERLNNDRLHEMCRSRPFTEMLRARRLRYVGHIARYPEERWVKRMLRSSLQGAGRPSGPGRPPLMWQKVVWDEVANVNPGLYGDSVGDEYSVKPLLGFHHCLDRARWRCVEHKGGIHRPDRPSSLPNGVRRVLPHRAARTHNRRP